MLGSTISVATCLAALAMGSIEGRAETRDPAYAQDPQTMTVAGHCVNQGSRPVARARVQLYLQDHERFVDELVASTLTDKDGSFRFEGLRRLDRTDWGHRRWYVVAEATKLAHGVAMIGSDVTPAADLEIVMFPPGDVRGTVTDENQQPVRDALVWLRSVNYASDKQEPRGWEAYNGIFLSQPLVEWSTRTDAEGGFTLTGLPSGARCEINVRQPGYGRDRTVVTVPGAMEVVLRRGLILEGRVTRGENKEAAAGVLVAAQGIRQYAWGDATTDREGRYRIESLPADEAYNVWADAEGWTVVAHPGVGGKGGDIIQLPDLELIEGGFIEGVVIDAATGQGVEPGTTADVGLYGPSRPRTSAAIQCADIGRDGRFRIRAAPGSNYIYLRAVDGWSTVGAGDHVVDVVAGEIVRVEFEVKGR